MAKQKKRKKSGARIAGNRAQRAVAPRRSVTALEDGRVMYSDGPAANAEHLPDPPLGCASAPLLVDGEPPVLFVPTLALLQLVSLAKRENLPILVPESVADHLDSDGNHQLTDLSRVTGEGVTDFVRCRVRCLMSGRDSLHPHEIFADFPSRYVGMLLNSAEKMERTHEAVDSVPDAVHRGPWSLPGPKPTWAGSFSFDRIWAEAEAKLRASSDAELVDGMWNVPPGIMVRAETVLHLAEAHLVRVEPEQMQVLPEWDDPQDLMDYARDCALPFPTMYLDFEGPGGLAPMHTVTLNLHDDDGVVRERADDMFVHLKGAVVRAERADDATENQVRQLLVVPYGEVQQGGRIAGGYEALGAFMFNAYPSKAIAETEMVTYPRDGRAPIRTVVPSVAVDVLMHGGNVDPDGPFNPGLVTLPFGSRELATNLGLEPGVKLNTQIVAWAGIVMSCASRVMAALSIMESEAVVVGDAPLEDRDRKRAEKRGWKIAQMVYVRPTRKGPRREPTGEERHYTHRFWVSGHYKHFPLGTRMADVRPDLVKPCTRHGAASCGKCRRIWTPPFIKGPDDKPLVVKSLVKRRHPELEEVG